MPLVSSCVFRIVEEGTLSLVTICDVIELEECTMARVNFCALVFLRHAFRSDFGALLDMVC